MAAITLWLKLVYTSATALQLWSLIYLFSPQKNSIYSGIAANNESYLFTVCKGFINPMMLFVLGTELHRKCGRWTWAGGNLISAPGLG